MLEKYQYTQKNAYKILKNAITKNEHSHAYIFEANGYNDVMSLALDFAKSLFCVNKNNDETSQICNLIEEGNYPELKIIDPDGMIIKREEIDELQYDFSKKPIYNDKKIYIINNAERLNKSASNAILKFLEEPEQDIVAILITNNIYEIISTIISRCQIITLRKEPEEFDGLTLQQKILKSINKTEEEINIIFEENVNCLTKCIDFVNYYEKYKLDTFIYVNEKWFNFYKEKNQFEVAFKVMTLYYVDILKKACHTKIEIFNDYESDIDNISQKLSINNICQKIKIIVNLEKKLKENNNLNLLMDKFLIELGRSDKCV